MAAAHGHALGKRGVDVEVGSVVEDGGLVQDVAHGIQLELKVSGSREVRLGADLEERRLQLPGAWDVGADLRHHLLEHCERGRAVELQRNGGLRVDALGESVATEAHDHLNAEVLLEVVECVLRGGLRKVDAHRRREQCTEDLWLGGLHLLGGGICGALLHDRIDRAREALGVCGCGGAGESRTGEARDGRERERTRCTHRLRT